MNPDQIQAIIDQLQAALKAQTSVPGTSDPSQATPMANSLMDIVNMQAALENIKSKAATDQLTRDFLGQKILGLNVLNYKGANTAYLDALGVGQAFGPAVLDIVKNNVTPFPATNVSLSNQVTNPPAPVSQGTTAPTTMTPNIPTTVTLASKVMPTWAKAAIAAVGIGGSAAAGWFAKPSPAPVPNTPVIQTQSPTTDEIEVF